MSWFSSNITTIEVLRKEYKCLARQHHPDIGGSEEDMKAINNEYDELYEKLNNKNKNPAFDSFWDTYYAAKQAREEAKKSREYIIFMMKNEATGNIFGFIKEEFRSFFGRASLNKKVIPNSSWTDIHEGFARCNIEKEINPGCYTVTGKNISLDIPTDEQMWKIVEKDHSSSYFNRWTAKDANEDAEYFLYFETPFGCFYTNEDKNTVYAVDEDNNPVVCNFVENGRLGEEKYKFNSGDFVFMAYQDCTFEEFLKYHDVDFKSEFHEALQMKATDGAFSYSGLISHLTRKGVLNIYQSRLDYTVKYGTFNLDALMKYLPNLTIDEVEEVQDFLDEINTNFNKKVRSKIKKGKLKIVTK